MHFPGTYCNIDEHGSLVKRLRRRPLTAETGVRFPYELLGFANVHSDSGRPEENYIQVRFVGQAVKTPPSHGGNRGSIPLRTVRFCQIHSDSADRKKIIYRYGSLVKRLRRRPLTAETGVRFPYELFRFYRVHPDGGRSEENFMQDMVRWSSG